MNLSTSLSKGASQGCLRKFSGRPQPLIRLVCFTWCGAGASVYRRFAAGLPDHIELLAVQLPGREDVFGEKKLRRMAEVIDHALPDIAAVFDRPLFLFGHSMGALVAHEMALALKARTGREPHGLIVSGHASPSRTLEKSRGGQRWHQVDDEAFIANLRQLGGTPMQVLNDSSMMRSLLPVLRADYEILETYVPPADAPLLSCPVIACAGKQDKEVAADDLGLWRHGTQGPFLAHWFPGDHFYLCAQPGLLTQRLQEWMAPGGRLEGSSGRTESGTRESFA
jgi:surfactin synthase thioesterase subunit